MSRAMNRALRLRQLEEMLEQRAYRAAELAEELGVSRRTIERDLLDLATRADVQGQDGRYRIPPRASALTEVEALAVHSATRLLLHTRVGGQQYRSALRKLVALLPEPARSALARSVDAVPATRRDRTLDKVAQAWFGRRVLRCKYRSARSDKHYPHEYEVLYFELNRRSLQPYVVARERLYFKGIGVFRLSRMKDVEVLDEAYEIPDDFDPAAYMEGAWGVTAVGEPVEVRLRVDPDVAAWFEEQSEVDRNVQVVARREDGSLEVVLHGRLARGGDAHEMVPFLLGWGAKVEVLGPESVRRHVAEEMARAVARYAGGRARVRLRR